MVYLATMFLGWNLTVLLIMAVMYGIGGLADRFKFVELILAIFLVSIFLLLFIPLSPLSYMLIKEHKETHGSYLRYPISFFKGMVEIFTKG